MPFPRPPVEIAPARATRREWVALGVIALPCLVYAMDLTVLNLALPAISADLRPSAAQLLWIIDIYGFMVAGLLITMGTLGDKIGRRRLLLIGAGAFAAASVAAALSTTAHALIATRALLGIAGATLAPSTLSLISNMFRDERERRTAIGIWISSYSVGGAIGPLVGGVILQYFAWPAIFWAAVPVMLLLLAVGPFLLPEYRDPEAGRLDLGSVALSLTAVLGGVFALKRAAEGHGDAPTWIAAALGLAAGVALVRRQRRIAYPLLDLRLFGQPRFAAAICTYALTSFAMFGVYIFISQHLQLVLSLSPLVAGLCTVPWALSFVVGSMLTPAIAQRYSAPRTMVTGLAVAALGFAGVAFVDGTHGLLALVAGMTLMGIGMAPVFTLGNDIVISSAPPRAGGRGLCLVRNQRGAVRGPGHRGVRQPGHGSLPRRHGRSVAGRPAPGRSGGGFNPGWCPADRRKPACTTGRSPGIGGAHRLRRRVAGGGGAGHGDHGGQRPAGLAHAAQCPAAALRRAQSSLSSPGPPFTTRLTTSAPKPRVSRKRIWRARSGASAGGAPNRLRQTSRARASSDPCRPATASATA